jgi:hypothetical protein
MHELHKKGLRQAPLAVPVSTLFIAAIAVAVITAHFTESGA